MAILNFYSEADMYEFYTYEGDLEDYSNTHLHLSDWYNDGIYYGNFRFSSAGVISGTVTGYENYTYGDLDYAISGVKISLSKLNTAFESSDSLAVVKLVLAKNDTINGSYYHDDIFGWTGNDIIHGNDGDDDLEGNAGNDTLIGGLGYDALYGGDGNDQLFGNSDDDFISGGNGKDKLSGGEGFDTFAFLEIPSSRNADIILDFDKSQDVIFLDESIFNAMARAGQWGVSNENIVNGKKAIDSNDFIVFDFTNGKLYYDADGNGSARAQLIVTLIGVSSIDADDISVGYSS